MATATTTHIGPISTLQIFLTGDSPAPDVSQTGGWLGWNLTDGNAETDFINVQPNSPFQGGFNWYNTPVGTVPDPRNDAIMTLDGFGNLFAEASVTVPGVRLLSSNRSTIPVDAYATLITQNFTDGFAETDFINVQPNAPFQGGFNWYNTPAGVVPDPRTDAIMILGGFGDLTVARSLSTQQFNTEYYVGEGGFESIQDAVDFVSANAGYGRIVIMNGYPYNEEISAVTGGALVITIYDERDGWNQNWAWDGTKYVTRPTRQAKGYITYAMPDPLPSDDAVLSRALTLIGYDADEGNGTGHLTVIGNDGAGMPAFELSLQVGDGSDPIEVLSIDGDGNTTLDTVTATCYFATGTIPIAFPNSAALLDEDPASNTARLMSKSNNAFLGSIELNGVDDTGRTYSYFNFSDGEDGPGASCNSPLTVYGDHTVEGDASISGSLMLSGDPTQPLEAATKQYVDENSGGGGGGGMVYPGAGVALSTGSAWGTSIPANTLARTNAANTFTAAQVMLVDNPATDALRIQSPSAAGYASIGFMDYTGAQAGSFGYANPATVQKRAITDAIFFGSNGHNMVFTSDNGQTAAMLLDVNGNVTLKGALTVEGGATLAGNLSATNSVAANGNGCRVALANYPNYHQSDDPPGTIITYNSLGNGESDFINVHPSGVSSGFAWFQGSYDTPGGPVIATLDAGGNFTCNGTITGSVKNFQIPYPLIRGGKNDPDLTLTHSSLEGPEIAVFYRGVVETSDGTALVTLPDYFEALTMPDQRTVLLTQMFDEDEDEPEFAMLMASQVREGQFTVRSSIPVATVAWEVKAVRADQPPLQVVGTAAAPTPLPEPAPPAPAPHRKPAPAGRRG